MKDINSNGDIKLILNQKMNKWCVSSPVQTVEYSLYYDYRYNRNYVNALFSNVSTKTVKSIYVDLECFDDAGDLIGTDSDLPLSGINALPETHFGDGNDLIVSYLNASSVSITVKKVVFEDSEVWRASEALELIEIPEQKAVSEDWELYPQLIRECEEGGVTPVYFPVFTDKLWVCTCSTVNENSSVSCHDCRADKKWLEEHFNAQYLSKKQKSYNDEHTARELALRYEDAKVKQKTYAGYIEAAEKMEALGYYMDAPALAKSYYSQAEQIKNETESRYKEEIYQSKKQVDMTSPEELRSAAAKLGEIAGYKDASKLSQEYTARAYAIERNKRKAEKKAVNLKKKQEQIKAAKRKKTVKILSIIGASALALALLVCMIVFLIVPEIKEASQQRLYDKAIEHVEKGEFSQAIEILKSLGTYNNSDKKIGVISKNVTGLDNAFFATSDGYPCYEITEDGILYFSSSEYKFKDGVVHIPDVFDNVLVRGLADNFLNDCDWVKKVIIPYKVQNISTKAFSGCTSLTEVVLHDDIRYIGKYAFYKCTSLESIEIPEYVNAIGAYAFSNCTSLKQITLPEKIKVVEEYTFNKCTSLKEIKFEGKINTIGNYAFSYCSSLESFNFSDNLEKLGSFSFAFCTGIKNVTIPDSLTSVEKNTFIGCSSLESITLGNKVESIGNNVFESCTSLKSVSLGTSVKTIGYEAFKGCAKLEEIVYNGTQQQWSAVSVGDNNEVLDNVTVKFN